MNFMFSWQEWQEFLSLKHKIHIFSPPCNTFYLFLCCDRGGIPIWSGRGCSSEILNLTPKRDQSGRGRSLCRPLKETSLYELSKYKEPKFFLFCYLIMTFCAEHPKRDQNPKFTPLSETTSIPINSIWEYPPGSRHTGVKMTADKLNYFYVHLIHIIMLKKETYNKRPAFSCALSSYGARGKFGENSRSQNQTSRVLHNSIVHAKA